MPDVTIIPSQDGPYPVSGPARLTAAGGREILHLNQGASGPRRTQAGRPIRPWTDHVRASRHDYYV